jgi:D-alanine-D-alanine ligase
MAKKLSVGVVFGGRSGEHEISIRSARAVIDGIDRKKYDVIPIAITKEGKWLGPAEAVKLLPQSTSRLVSPNILNSASHDVAIIGDPTYDGLTGLKDAGLQSTRQRLDVVFPVLHGPFGEDGTIQGLLEMAGVPYVGCGVLASSCGMDKVAMKALFRDAGLPICKYVWFLRNEWEANPDAITRRIKRELGFPCFVKPANLGSSVGISRATDNESLKKAIALAARYDRKLIVEKGLDAREIECAVIGNDQPEASLPGEYMVFDETAKFLDYKEKYTNTGHVEFVVPARLPLATIKKIQNLAIRAFKSLDGAGLSRVDFFLRRDTKELIVNELNTMPGLTDVSGYPKMWAASGRDFQQVIDELISLALERHKDKLRNQTNRSN